MRGDKTDFWCDRMLRVGVSLVARTKAFHLLRYPIMLAYGLTASTSLAGKVEIYAGLQHDALYSSDFMYSFPFWKQTSTSWKMHLRRSKPIKLLYLLDSAHST